jgi:hypothetical protein
MLQDKGRENTADIGPKEFPYIERKPFGSNIGNGKHKGILLWKREGAVAGLNREVRGSQAWIILNGEVRVIGRQEQFVVKRLADSFDDRFYVVKVDDHIVRERIGGELQSHRVVMTVEEFTPILMVDHKVCGCKVEGFFMNSNLIVVV